VIAPQTSHREQSLKATAELTRAFRLVKQSRIVVGGMRTYPQPRRTSESAQAVRGTGKDDIYFRRSRNRPVIGGVARNYPTEHFLFTAAEA
jgi:hypothetical protein